MPNVSSVATYNVEVKERSGDYTNLKVGIKKFKDNRDWIKDIKENQQGYFSSDSGTKNAAKTRKFGITYNGQPFRPINQIVQDALIKEIASYGFIVSTYLDSEEYDFVVDGRIDAFQANLDTGSGRNKGRSVINMYIDLSDGDGQTLMNKKQYLAVDAKTTMWVDSAANRLLNNVLKEALAEYLADFESNVQHALKSGNHR